MNKKQQMDLLPTNKKILSTTVLVMLMIAGISVIAVNGASYDTSQGSFTLDAIPTVSGVQFVDAAYSLTSTLTPDDSTIFGLNFTVTFPAGMDDLHNITINIFDDSLHGSDYAANDPNGYDHIRVTWVESTATWSIDQDTLTGWTEQSSIDAGVANPATTFDFCFRYDMSKITRADTDWNATVAVYDDDSPADADEAAETGLVTVENYFELTFSSSTFSWGTVDSLSVNSTHGALTIDIIANTAWELQINATDFNASGEADVDIEANDIIALDGDGSSGGESQWIRNTIAVSVLATWDAQSALTTESAVSRNVYILLSTSTFFDAGSGKVWSTWVTIWCQADT